jgi:hypothetical protein
MSIVCVVSSDGNAKLLRTYTLGAGVIGAARNRAGVSAHSGSARTTSSATSVASASGIAEAVGESIEAEVMAVS